MKTRLRLLHLEDSSYDATLIRTKLAEEGFSCDVIPAQSRATFEAALAQGPFDLILSDFKLPDFDGLTALSMAREKDPHVLFILLSGTLGEEQAVDSLKGGATVCILKQRLRRLVPAGCRALKDVEVLAQRKQAEEVLRTSEERFRVTLK